MFKSLFHYVPDLPQLMASKKVGVILRGKKALHGPIEHPETVKSVLADLATLQKTPKTN